MSGLSSCNSWKDLKRPDNPFYGAMVSKSHRKRKRKRVLQPIDNPNERGRSLEPKKSEGLPPSLRSISVENSTIFKNKREISKTFILDPCCQTILSTETSLESKLPPKPKLKSEENNYSELDKAIFSNAVSIRNKYIKPLHPGNPKPQKVFKRGRKFVKSPTSKGTLPFAPDLKPVTFNTFQLHIPSLELEYSQFYMTTQMPMHGGLEELLKSVNCKICLN